MLIALMSEDEFLHRALHVPLQPLQWDIAKRYGVDVWVRRDDLVDSALAGNKFYKLFYNLQQAKKLGHQTILTFGGAYSNHIHALAAAGRDTGFNTIAVIRGERPKILSPTLQDAERWGMNLHFVSRSDYQQKNLPELHEKLTTLFGDFYMLPEGGANVLGLQGTQVIGWALAQQQIVDINSICLACGTGNTMAGIVASTPPTTKVIGFSVLKGEGGLAANILDWHSSILMPSTNWCLVSGYHGGGYAKKIPSAMQTFCDGFEQETQIKLDPVYTVKLCWGVAQLITQRYWPRGSRLVLVHTGGLQGRRGFSW